jgi:hypothetical protein
MSLTVVTVVNQGTRFWLKGTTWSFSLDRADRFPTTDAAFAAIAKASKFNKASVMKRAELWDEAVALKE